VPLTAWQPLPTQVNIKKTMTSCKTTAMNFLIHAKKIAKLD